MKAVAHIFAVTLAALVFPVLAADLGRISIVEPKPHDESWVTTEDGAVNDAGEKVFWGATAFFRPFPLPTFHRPVPIERTVETVRIARIAADKLLSAFNSGLPSRMLRMMAPGMFIQDYTIFSLMSYWSRKGEVELDYWYKNMQGHEFEKFPLIIGADNLTRYVEAINCHTTKEEDFCWDSSAKKMSQATMLEDFGTGMLGKFPLDAMSWCRNIDSNFVETSFTAGRNGFTAEYMTRIYLPTEYDRIFDQHFVQRTGETQKPNTHYFMPEVATLCGDFLVDDGDGCSNELNYDESASQVYSRNLNTPDAIRDECDDSYFMEVEFAVQAVVDVYSRLMRIFVYGPDHRALWWQHVVQNVCGGSKGIRQTCILG